MWLAYQLNRPDHKDGIILAFRRGDCGNDSIRVNPRGLDEKATYELFYLLSRFLTSMTCFGTVLD